MDNPCLYMKVARALREQIKDGEFKPGTPLPSIDAIRQETGCSRQTIGKALRLLASEGLIARVAGHSYYVE
jgi:DNA-binding GntR family transcriptional regulator